jgi:hypothetical protein
VKRIFPPLRGGVAARSKKSRVASLARADGVVFNLGKIFVEFDRHPVRSSRGGFATFLLKSPDSALGNTQFQNETLPLHHSETACSLQT